MRHAPNPVSDLCPARTQALLTLAEVDKKAAFVNLALRELLRQKRLPAMLSVSKAM